MDAKKLKLIKDFRDGDFVLYWMDDLLKERYGPEFVTLEDAEEWWLQYQFSQYRGSERRSSTIDRRRQHQRRQTMARGNHVTSNKPDGRRYTDCFIRIDMDISRHSLMRFMATQLSG